MYIRILRSPDIVRVRGIKRTPLVAKRRLDRPGASVTGFDWNTYCTSPQNRPGRCRGYSPEPVYGDFVFDSMLYREPVGNITEDWSDMVELSPYQQQVSRQRSRPFISNTSCFEHKTINSWIMPLFTRLHSGNDFSKVHSLNNKLVIAWSRLITPFPYVAYI